jgi:hypothetical protein
MTPGTVRWVLGEQKVNQFTPLLNPGALMEETFVCSGYFMPGIVSSRYFIL